MGISRLPGVLDSNQLQPAETARTVRVHDGETLTTDGPPVDSAGVLDSYYVYEAPDLETAVELAARLPATRRGGTIEVRPVVERQPRLPRSRDSRTTSCLRVGAGTLVIRRRCSARRQLARRLSSERLVAIR
jgi:uncharacterized protein YciI